MSIQQSLQLPVVQMGHVEKLVEIAQNQPLVQQQVTQELTKHELHRENTQVQGIDHSEAGRKVKAKEREEDRRRQGQGNTKRAAKSSEAGHDPPDQDVEEPSLTPWVGHIVNVKI